MRCERRIYLVTTDSGVQFTSIFYMICTYALLFISAAAAFNGYFDKSKLQDWRNAPDDIYGPATFASMLDGTAWRPYVYRQLVPTMANLIDSAVPDSVQNRLYNWRNGIGLPIHDEYFTSPVARSRAYFFRYWIVWAIEIACCLIAAFTVYKLTLESGFSVPVSTVTSIAFILLTPYCMEPLGHIYDYPEIVFFLVSALLAIKGRWWILIPLAALSTFNKESYLLYIPALYPLLRVTLLRAKSWATVIGMGAMSVIVNIYVHLKFRSNPGDTIEQYIWQQIRDVKNLFLMPHPHMTYGIIQPRSENIFTLLFAVWAVWLGWRYLPTHYRRHVVIAAAINLPLFVLFGFPGEIRILSMLYPTLAMFIAVHSNEWISQALGGSVAERLAPDCSSRLRR